MSATSPLPAFLDRSHDSFDHISDNEPIAIISAMILLDIINAVTMAQIIRKDDRLIYIVCLIFQEYSYTAITSIDEQTTVFPVRN